MGISVLCSGYPTLVELCKDVKARSSAYAGDKPLERKIQADVNML